MISNKTLFREEESERGEKDQFNNNNFKTPNNKINNKYPIKNKTIG